LLLSVAFGFGFLNGAANNGFGAVGFQVLASDFVGQSDFNQPIAPGRSAFSPRYDGAPS
jgi:hypothetical protein